MSSIIKTVFGGSSSPSAMGAKSPSFNDLSAGTGAEYEQAQEEFTKAQAEEPNSPTSPISPKGMVQRSRSGGKNAWAGVFNPGRNYHDNMKQVGSSYYDSVDKAAGNSSVWDHILRAERQKAFSSFDRDNDGFITADELRLKLGGQADVGQLIQAADKNGDGKIDYQEFCELLKNA